MNASNIIGDQIATINNVADRVREFVASENAKADAIIEALSKIKGNLKEIMKLEAEKRGMNRVIEILDAHCPRPAVLDVTKKAKRK